jgi:hypothetical protein
MLGAPKKPPKVIRRQYKHYPYQPFREDSAPRLLFFRQTVTVLPLFGGNPSPHIQRNVRTSAAFPFQRSLQCSLHLVRSTHKSRNLYLIG